MVKLWVCWTSEVVQISGPYEIYVFFQFTKFVQIQDIPKEFITKHVKLHGQVRWVGVTPPTSTPTPTLTLPHPSPPSTSTPTPMPSDQSTTQTSISSNNKSPTKETARSASVKSLSEDNRGIYEGAGELHPWENNIDPDIARIDFEEDLQPLYVKV